LLGTFHEQGYSITEPIIGAEQCALLAVAVTALSESGAGTRSLLALPWCRDFAMVLLRHPVLRPFLPPAAVAVQCTYFEKTPQKNWLVPMHQDLSIPVAQRVEHPQLMGWSEKEGAIFVQPPASVLENILAVRVHLDACGAEDGALRVVPQSHRAGRHDEVTVQAMRQSRGEVLCCVPQGAALLLSPLLLHASSKGTSGKPRRVLHFLFARPALPFGLRWHDSTLAE
jgi:ectoine hydroxylase-related dioxygenase (phytanoyl-CoA dioxygenase family)